MRWAVSQHAVLLLAFVGVIAGLAPGCGSTLVEPGRSRMPPPVLSSPAAAVPVVPESVSSGNSLPHVPLSRLLPAVPVEAAAVYHEVQPGETLSAVASRYGVPPERLRKANGFEASPSLKPGQLIYIPGPG